MLLINTGRAPLHAWKPECPAADPKITRPRCSGWAGAKINHMSLDEGLRFRRQKSSREASTTCVAASRTRAGKLRARNLCTCACRSPDAVGSCTADSFGSCTAAQSPLPGQRLRRWLLRIRRIPTAAELKGEARSPRVLLPYKCEDGDLVPGIWVPVVLE